MIDYPILKLLKVINLPFHNSSCFFLGAVLELEPFPFLGTATLLPTLLDDSSSTTGLLKKLNDITFNSQLITLTYNK